MKQQALVELRAINEGNWYDCVQLRVAPDQQNLICENSMSLAEAGFRTNAYADGIYCDAEMVGLMVYILDQSKGWAEIHRFMIAAAHQRRGFGSAALYAVLRKIRTTLGEAPEVIVKFLHWNSVAEALYRNLGFIDTGRVEQSEKVFQLDWQAFDKITSSLV